MIGYLALWSVFWIFKLLTGKDGMGYGDFKLLAALGAWLGALNLPVVILLSSVVGLVFAVAMRLNTKLAKGQAMPFGPYLACAGWLAFMFGNEIVAWWLQRGAV
jgi:leader peptidase (prepilin peptidase)/N-methyltransferase